jgi:glucose uptake protein GlcU
MKIKTAANAKITNLAVSDTTPVKGDNVTLTATATGDLISYEWKFANKIIEGETSDALVINDIGLDQAGLYTVTAKNFNSNNRKSKKITVSKRENEVLVVVGSKPVTCSVIR